MKKLEDFYKEDPQAYADIVAQANREGKKIEIVDDKLVLRAKEPIVLDYEKLRDREYPAIKDQLDMLWHAIDENKLDKTCEFYSTLKQVKDKYPKEGNSNESSSN